MILYCVAIQNKGCQILQKKPLDTEFSSQFWILIIFTWYLPGLPSLPKTESRVGGGAGGSDSKDGELRLILELFFFHSKLFLDHFHAWNCKPGVTLFYLVAILAIFEIVRRSNNTSFTQRQMVCVFKSVMDVLVRISQKDIQHFHHF